MAEVVKLKKNPYGKSVFSTLRQGNYAYVDKTRYIELLEEFADDHPFILRPRRFGKSLFTLTLEAYYDEYYADEFEKNFAGTYIAEHKTPLASAFRVIHFDFSGFSSSPDLGFSFKGSVKRSIEGYFSRYPHPRQMEVLTGKYPDASSLMEAFLGILGDTCRQKLYVIIDEYDQFANAILASDVHRFKNMTSRDGFYKDFFTTLKKATKGAVAHVFITGVSAFSLDSMTSGFNVADKITSSSVFSGMFGFTERELRDLIPQIVDLKASGLDVDKVISRLKEWYNGYRFSSLSDETVFNSTMCLYYLRSLRREKKEPSEMLDSNLGQDLETIENTLRLADSKVVESVIRKALAGKAIPFKETPSDLNLNGEDDFDEESVLSALFYMGFLTFVPGKKAELCIPNQAIKIQFFRYYLKHIMHARNLKFSGTEFESAKRELAQGKPEAFIHFICDRYRDSSGLHSHAHLRESNFQTLLVTGFLLTNMFTISSEQEIQGCTEAKGYADILAVPQKGSGAKFSYLIEIKHLKASEGRKKATLEKTISEAKAQLDRYAQGRNIRNIKKLKRIIAVFVGVELKVLEVFD